MKSFNVELGKYECPNHVLELARLARGESVLDVGCGTGTLAIAAKGLVGRGGRVVGADASHEMIARAKANAARWNIAIKFVEGAAQDLPFAHSIFDAVVSTPVIHCLPDFGGSAASKHSLFGHLHVHRRFDVGEEKSRLTGAGLDELASGETGFADLHYLLAGRVGKEARRRCSVAAI